MVLPTFPRDVFAPLADDDDARGHPIAFTANRDRQLVPFTPDARYGRLSLPPFGERIEDAPDELPA
jgi:hypothetical protein